MYYVPSQIMGDAPGICIYKSVNHQLTTEQLTDIINV